MPRTRTRGLSSFVVAAVFCISSAVHAAAAADPPAFRSYSGIEFTVAQARGEPIIVLVGEGDACTICEQQLVVLTDVLSLPDFQEVRTFWVDIDRDAQFLKAYRVNQPSTIILFRDGGEVGRVVGMTGLGALCGLLTTGLLAA